MKIYIRSMGLSRKDIIENLDNDVTQIIRHLIKIYIYRDRGNLTHWSRELYKYIPAIPNLKGKNKFPNAQTILSGLWDRSQKRIPRIILGVLEDYDYQPYDYNLENVRNYVYRYLEWMAQELSAYGVLKGEVACANKAVEILNECTSGQYKLILHNP